TIIVKFDTNPTGIVEVASQKGLIYDVFNTQGTLLYRQLTSLSSLPKGIYILKQTGSKKAIKKFVVR
ncbi:T9SS type A sorting domain-containing protein, partial [uncultured Prevotella sp.]|uniref:T9SS type A sorting domain-containing protein n=1 Tax=uncultured Prevotella sp. TaxID=159272 RepID=UPI00259B78EE